MELPKELQGLAKGSTVGFDLDGTILDLKYQNDPREFVPRKHVVQWAKALLDMDHQIAIITSRHYDYTELSIRQVSECFESNSFIVDFYPKERLTQESIVDFKVKALQQRRCLVYVGDDWEIDGKAAQILSIPFVYVGD